MSFQNPTPPAVLGPNGQKAPAASPNDGEVTLLTEDELKEVKHLLDKAMFNFYYRYPFYALLLDRCQMLVTRRVPTAAISNTAKLYINPEFFHGLEAKQRLFLLAHEIMHAAFRHHMRCLSRQPKLWNFATDYIINDALVKDIGADAMIPGGLLSNNLNPDLTSEDVYEMLLNIDQDKKNGQGQGQGGGSGGKSPRGQKLQDDNPNLNQDMERDYDTHGGYTPDLLDEDIDDAQLGRGNSDETPQTREEWEGAMAQAATRAKMMGRLPAHMDMAIQDFLKPKVDWAKKLVSSISRVVSMENRNDYSWMRPSRRFLHEDMILPSIIGHKRRVATWVDTSGSMYGNWMQAVSDIERVRKQYGIQCYHMWQDAEVYPVGWLDPYQPFPKMAAGGGGTSFVPVFEHLKETKIINEVDCVVGFTDMWGTFPEDPGVPTIWVSFSDEPAPFGQLITVKEQDLRN
jgi:predicted metal-dependent peptidase